ncbi:MAG: DUF2069 domain-containing protein [Neisseria sp.]|nr:DUF2069 domain-containing protein [Neisseria sp.]
MDNRKTNRPHFWAAASLLALIFISAAWELWIAPLRPGGSWLALKALPLCLPLAGILKGKIYTFQWSCMMVLAYFAEAVMRLFDATWASRACAAAALVCSTVFFVSCLLFVRNARREMSRGH